MLVIRFKMRPRLLLMCFFLHNAALIAAEEPKDSTGAEHGLVIEQETQQRLGLETIELQAAHYRPEFIAYGIVQDLQPLLDLRNRYFAAQAAQNISAARLKQAQQNLTRLNALYREDIIAQSKLQTQQAQWQADQAQAGADQYQVAAIRVGAELQWGKKLADLALSNASAPILAPNAKLLLVTLPPERSLPAQLKTIDIARAAERRQASVATFVSAAPQTSGAFQGETYFFSTNDAALRIGMRVTAWIEQQSSELQGVMIPATSVVWHLGQAFVYIQDGDDRFERCAIDTSFPSAQGYFVREPFTAGEKLVTTGAQMLLSEEFRTQIPSEDDD